MSTVGGRSAQYGQINKHSEIANIDVDQRESDKLEMNLPKVSCPASSLKQSENCVVP